MSLCLLQVVLASYNATNKKVAIKIVKKRLVLKKNSRSAMIELKVFKQIRDNRFNTCLYGGFQTDVSLVIYPFSHQTQGMLYGPSSRVTSLLTWPAITLLLWCFSRFYIFLCRIIMASVHYYFLIKRLNKPCPNLYILYLYIGHTWETKAHHYRCIHWSEWLSTLIFQIGQVTCKTLLLYSVHLHKYMQTLKQKYIILQLTSPKMWCLH